MQDDKRNAEYTLIFTILPLVTAAAFLPALLSSSATTYQRTLCFLSIMSLLASAYIMKYIPLRRPNRKDKGLVREVEEDSTPLGRHLIPANAALCALLTLASCFIGGWKQSDGVQWIPYLVPGAVLGTIWVAQRVMTSVDVGQLEDLRYEYKGA